MKAAAKKRKLCPDVGQRHHWVSLRAPSRIERPRVYNREAKAWTYGQGPSKVAPGNRGPIIGRRCTKCRHAEQTRGRV